jgi:endonuclease-8
MPEGDTIFRTARTLHRALSGQTVTRFETVLPKLARVDYDTPLAGRILDLSKPAVWVLMHSAI